MPLDSIVGAPPPHVDRSRHLQAPIVAAAFFSALIVLQVLGYWILGTGRAGMGVSETILVLHNRGALACTWVAFRRAQGTASLFWVLFGAFLLFLLIPNLLNCYGTVFHHSIVERETWRVLYCLYGAPILMMLLLPTADGIDRFRSEIFLDFFQVAVVVAFAFTSFLYLPLQQMLPTEALQHNLNVSNLLSGFLLVAAISRLCFTRSPAARDLLLRITVFLLVSGPITAIGNWIDLHQYMTASAWWDVAWDFCYIAPGLVAITWFPAPAPQGATEPARFLSFLGKNVALVAILVSIDLMSNRWKATHGAALSNAAVGISLLAFTVRLALTQFRQQQEIAQRKAGQEALRLDAVRDPLTGLYNRRYMEEVLERELHRARRRERPLAVMMIDIDHFKRYNDSYGHPAGDDALRLVGETLLRGVRGEDLACRYGGEEFIVILPECSLQNAAVRADEVRMQITSRSQDPSAQLRSPVTASIGVAAFLETTSRMDLLLKLADEALYEAKRAGRNRVVVARPEVPAPPEPATHHDLTTQKDFFRPSG